MNFKELFGIYRDVLKDVTKDFKPTDIFRIKSKLEKAVIKEMNKRAIKMIISSTLAGFLMMIVPILMAAIIGIAVIGVGASALMVLFNEEDNIDDTTQGECTCYFLTQEEIDALMEGQSVTVTVPGGSGGTTQVGTGGSGASANISGEKIAGDFVNDAYWAASAILERYGSGIPLWILYGMTSVETGGSLYIESSWTGGGAYLGLDKQLDGTGSGAATGMFQVENTVLQSVAATVQSAQADAESWLLSIGLDVSKYPGSGAWYAQPKYFPAAVMGASMNAERFLTAISSSPIMQTEEYSALSASERQFVMYLYVLTQWNNGINYMNNSSDFTSGNDPIVRKYFAAFAKLMGDSEFVQLFSSSNVVAGGNRSPGAKKIVMAQALAKGYLTQSDIDHINQIPFDNHDGDDRNGVWLNDQDRAREPGYFCNREIHYSTNAVYNCLTGAKSALAQHGITVEDWGFFGGSMYSSGTQSNTNNTSQSNSQGSSTVAGNTLQLHYTAENYESGFNIEPQHEITECKKIVLQDLPVTCASGYPMDRNTLDGFVVHYVSENNSLVSLQQNVFNNSTSTSTFGIEESGALAQFIPMSGYCKTQNEFNSNKLSVEVANYHDAPSGSAGYGKESQYSQAAYETLVHLTAYLAVELNFDLDFDFIENNKGNKYWDRGTINRHYDSKKLVEETGEWVFRGKACPADWVPNDDSTEDDSRIVRDGGQARWISFKVEVIKFILKYKDDPNFPITFADGTEMHGLDWARQATTGTFNWDSAEVSALDTITGGADTENGSTSNNTQTVQPSTGNITGGNTITLNPSTEGGREFQTSCAMATLGYCGCYSGDANCKCGCGGRSDVVYRDGSDGSLPGSGDSSGTTTSGGETIEGSTGPSYSAENGFNYPVNSNLDFSDIKSTGVQRLMDTAFVIYQDWYSANQARQSWCPLYTWDSANSSFNYTGLKGMPYTINNDDVNKSWGFGRRDCSSYISMVITAMGVPGAEGLPGTSSLIGMNFTNFQTITGSAAEIRAQLQPGDIVVRSGHTEMFMGWADEASKLAYVLSWGGSARLNSYPNTNTNDTVQGGPSGTATYRGKTHAQSGEGPDETYGVNGYPMNADKTIITGPGTANYSNSKYTRIFRYTGL